MVAVIAVVTLTINVVIINFCNIPIFVFRVVICVLILLCCKLYFCKTEDLKLHEYVILIVMVVFMYTCNFDKL